VVAALAGAAAAGATVPSPPSGPAPGSRWSYPRGHRDPLVPPPALYAGQDLPPITVTLVGVDSHRPDRPLAVVRLDSRPPVRRVVRPGDRVGAYRVLSIRPGRVRVAAPRLGGSTVLDVAVADSSPSNP
jgi:hypothetical protein